MIKIAHIPELADHYRQEKGIQCHTIAESFVQFEAGTEHFFSVIRCIGFVHNSSEACLYAFQQSNDAFVILLYTRCRAIQPDLLMRFVDHLRSVFTISSEGPIETYCNIRIDRSISSRTATLCMAGYKEILFLKYRTVPIPNIANPV